MDQELQTIPAAWTPKEVMQQVQAIQQLMRDGMTQDEHYGIIPGTNSKKPTLLKSGAEKLGLMFRLAPKYEITENNLPNNHKEFRITCSLYHINTGSFWGQGVGYCSTMESKYRYRSGVGESTKVQVPKAYWDLRRVGKSDEALQLIGGKGYTTKKGDDGLWWIHEKIEKTENPDIADVYNTALKIGKKRALVDATLTATAASDIFTQDLEEIMPEKVEAAKVVEEVKPEPVKAKSGDELISHDEQLELIRLLKEKRVSKDEYLGFLEKTWGIAGTAKIQKKHYDTVYGWIIMNEGEKV